MKYIIWESSWSLSIYFQKFQKDSIFFLSYGILEVREIYFILTTSLILFSILILCDK